MHTFEEMKAAAKDKTAAALVNAKKHNPEACKIRGTDKCLNTCGENIGDIGNTQTSNIAVRTYIPGSVKIPAAIFTA